MTRYTRSDLENLVRHLDVEAKLAGILPMDHRLGYAAGNTTNGISAQVWHFDAEGKPVHGTRFFPEFNYKQGPSEQAKLLEAALNVFFAMRVHQEAAKRSQTVERETAKIMLDREVTAHDQRSYRLAKEREEYKRDPAPDTKAILERLEREQIASGLRITTLKLAIEKI